MTEQLSHAKWSPAAVLLALVAASVLCAPGCFKFNLNIPTGGGDSGSPAPSDTAGGWMGTAMDMGAQMALAAEHGTIFYAEDIITPPKKPVELTARVLSVAKKAAAKNVTVEFSRGDKRLGLAQTGEDGNARLTWMPGDEGDYPLTAKIAAVPQGAGLEEMLKVTPASLLVSVRDKDTRVIVIDLDHTVVDAGFFRVLVSNPKPMAGSAKLIEDLAKKGYGIVYLTHRPNLMTVKSKKWLGRHGFLHAPLLTSTFRQSVGDGGEFKAARIEALRKSFPKTNIGIGDKFSDAEAYIANGLTAYLIPDYDRDTDDEEDLRKLAKRIRKIDKRIQVVDGWEDVRAGILQGKKFPPADYAARLEARAQEIKAEEKKDDDDN